MNRRGRHALLLVAITLAVVAYILLRFDGQFASQDVSVHGRVAATIKATGSITTKPVYNNGFGYPGLVAMFSMFTGLSVATLQSYIMPLFMMMPVLAGYITFREILGYREGLFGAVLLLFHPFFLFSAFRATHEKFTYAFILLSIFILYIIFTTSKRSTRSRSIITSYIFISAIIMLNVYFASALIAASGIVFIGSLLFSVYYRKKLKLTKIVYTVSGSIVLLALFVFYLYPPAKSFLESIGSVSLQALVLVLGNAPAAASGEASPYASTLTRWGSLSAYLALISYYLIVYPVAGLQWLAEVRSLLDRKRTEPTDRLTGSLFVLLFAAAFGFLLIGAIISDQTGLLGANMQLRVFPLFGFLCVLLTTSAIFRVNDKPLVTDGQGPLGYIIENRGNIQRRLRVQVLPTLVILMLVSFSGAAMVKATNDPVVSNEWTATTQSEQAMIDWSEDYMQDEYIWSGFSARIRDGRLIRHPQNGLRNEYEVAALELGARYVMKSDIITKQSKAGSLPIPPHQDANKIYTTGQSELFWFEKYNMFGKYNEAWSE